MKKMISAHKCVGHFTRKHFVLAQHFAKMRKKESNATSTRKPAVKCPKCGFVSFAGLGNCKKCGYQFFKPTPAASAPPPRMASSPSTAPFSNGTHNLIPPKTTPASAESLVKDSQ